jgi:hypothetical protein
LSTLEDGDELASKANKNHEEKAKMPLRNAPVGGLSANVFEMIRFMKMVLADSKSNDQQFLKPETLKEMLHQKNKAEVLDASIQNGLV